MELRVGFGYRAEGGGGFGLAAVGVQDLDCRALRDYVRTQHNLEPQTVNPKLRQQDRIDHCACRLIWGFPILKCQSSETLDPQPESRHFRNWCRPRSRSNGREVVVNDVEVGRNRLSVTTTMQLWWKISGSGTGVRVSGLGVRRCYTTREHPRIVHIALRKEGTLHV